MHYKWNEIFASFYHNINISTRTGLTTYTKQVMEKMKPTNSRSPFVAKARISSSGCAVSIFLQNSLTSENEEVHFPKKSTHLSSL